MQTSMRHFMMGSLFAVLAFAQASSARAEAVYFTHRSVLESFFPKSERVTYRRLDIDAAMRRRLVERLGYAPGRGVYTVFLAMTADRLDGYAFIDEEMGQHEPITFAVKFSADCVVERQEVMIYRESRGHEIRQERFRRQFVGRTGRDALRLAMDIDAISGATISSAAMAVGVKRAIAIVEELKRATPAHVPNHPASP